MGPVPGRLPALRVHLERAGKDVVAIGPALRPVPEKEPEENVVREQEWPVIDLDEDVLDEVVVAQVADDLGALGHPVQPDGASPSAAANQVVPDHHVDRGMELDRRHLGPGKKFVGVNVLENIALHRAEDAAQAAHDPRLPAVGNLVVPHKVASDGLPIPAVVQSALDGFVVGGRRFRTVVPFVAVFAQGDAHAS